MVIMRANSNNYDDLKFSGKLLVADFQSAIANLVTMETANYAAEQSEKAALQTIETIGSGTNGLYITPRDIPGAAQQILLRSSLDAHIKKVQARQIASYTADQLTQIETNDYKKFVGKKVHIKKLNSDLGAIESYWFDNKTGKESRGVIKTKTVKGIIEELSFSKNLLVIRPLLASRLLLSARKYFLVSVIDPETLEPLVEVVMI